MSSSFIRMWSFVYILFVILPGVEVSKKLETINVNGTMSTLIDLRSEKHLKERWDRFMNDRSKKLQFDPNLSSPTTIYSVEGKEFYISCGFNRKLSGKLKVSFLRLYDLSLISVGKKLHLGEVGRMSVISTKEKPNMWTLKVLKARINDTGFYECQVNTHPKAMQKMFEVRIVKSKIKLSPNKRVVYVNEGADLKLTCKVNTGPLVPKRITWYKDNKLVEFSDSIQASVFTKFSNSSSSTADSSIRNIHQDHTSDLVIESVKTSDSGEFRCGTDLTKSEAKIRVRVVREKHQLHTLELGALEKSDFSKIKNSKKAHNQRTPASSSRRTGFCIWSFSLFTVLHSITTP